MKRGDIIVVQIPRSLSSSGHEQFGARPALIVHSDDAVEEELKKLLQL